MSNLQQKRQTFRKEIRREQIEQKFRKIRIQLYIQLNQSFESNDQKQKVMQILEKLQENDIFRQFSEGSVRSDLSQEGQRKILQLLKVNEEDLDKPNEKVLALLQFTAVKTKINQKWQEIFIWEEKYGENFQRLVKDIANSMCDSSYHVKIVQFLLNAINFLIYANKIVKLRRAAFRQNEIKYLVGGPQEFYRTLLRQYIKNALMNFTATEDQTLLIPFVLQISRVIKQSAYFSPIYHNLFLTNDITLGQKLQMYSEFLEFLSQNQMSFLDFGQTYTKIMYLIHRNRPFMFKVNYKNVLKTVELNYTCLKLLNHYIGVISFRIEQCYVLEPHSEEYDSITDLAYVLQSIMTEQEHLLQSVPQMSNIMDFMINRLKNCVSVPQIKCARIVLSAFGHLSRHPMVMKIIEQEYFVLGIQLERLLEKMWTEVFGEIESYKQKSQMLDRFEMEEHEDFINSQSTNNQNYQQLTQEMRESDQLPKSQKTSDLTSQMSKLKLECIREIIYIYNSTCNQEQKYWTHLKTHLIQKLLITSSVYMQNSQQLPHLKPLKNECIELTCQLVLGFIHSSKQTVQESTLFPIEDILFGQFFFDVMQQGKKMNLFALIGCQIDWIVDNTQSSTLLVVQSLLPMMHELLVRILYELESSLSYYSQQNPSLSPQDIQSFLQKDKWAAIYLQLNQNQQIHKKLQKILFHDSSIHSQNCRSLKNNEKAASFINDILNLVDQVDKIIVNDNNSDGPSGQSCLIELQK